MRRKRKTEGFTLLEVIIVVIIIGILTGLAVPKIVGLVEYSRSAEALTALGMIRHAMDRCYLSDGDYWGCQNFSDLDVTDPGILPNAHFIYILATTGTDDYAIQATRNALNGGNVGDYIKFVGTATGGLTITGTGAFVNVGN